jgi:nucleolar protein 14
MVIRSVAILFLVSSSYICNIQTQLSRITDSIQRLLKFSHQYRRPLHLQAHKPIPIPTYIPKFETTTSNYLRQRDPDHEKNQAAKLRAQYKQERKGAIRELRKDAKFLAGVEQKKQFEKDRGYNERMRRVFGSIEGERAEEKRMEKEKAKEKRRAGRSDRRGKYMAFMSILESMHLSHTCRWHVNGFCSPTAAVNLVFGDIR